MAAETNSKIREVQGRHTLYLPADLIHDSTFPFDVNEELVVRIQDKRLIVESARASR